MKDELEEGKVTN